MGLFGKRPPVRPSDAEIMVGRLERHVDEAEMRYLDVLRRELANLLLESDPLLFDRTYRKARLMASDMARADAALVEAEESALLQRYRHSPTSSSWARGMSSPTSRGGTWCRTTLSWTATSTSPAC